MEEYFPPPLIQKRDDADEKSIPRPAQKAVRGMLYVFEIRLLSGFRQHIVRAKTLQLLHGILLHGKGGFLRAGDALHHADDFG